MWPLRTEQASLQMRLCNGDLQQLDCGQRFLPGVSSLYGAQMRYSLPSCYLFTGSAQPQQSVKCNSIICDSKIANMINETL